MEGKNRYRPSKTQLTLTELKGLCDALKSENRKLNAELQKAKKDRAWAMDKLQDAQEQNRQLGLMITYLTEKGDNNVEMDTRPTVD